MAVALRITPRSAPRLLTGLTPVFRDPQRRVVLGTPEPVACPFCDRCEDLVIIRRPGVPDGEPLYHVSCRSCGAEGPQARSRRRAAVLWNDQGVTAENRYHRLLCGPGEA